jgi:hypothetical protein
VGVIGKWLSELSPECEDAVLTKQMRPGLYRLRDDLGPCLVGVASGFNMDAMTVREVPPCRLNRGEYDPLRRNVEGVYDDVCARFGVAYINATIRQRILRNQLRRTLVTEPIMEAVTP